MLYDDHTQHAEACYRGIAAGRSTIIIVSWTPPPLALPPHHDPPIVIMNHLQLAQSPHHVTQYLQKGAIDLSRGLPP